MCVNVRLVTTVIHYIMSTAIKKIQKINATNRLLLIFLYSNNISFQNVSLSDGSSKYGFKSQNICTADISNYVLILILKLECINRRNISCKTKVNFKYVNLFI